MQLAGTNHDQLKKDEDWTHDLKIHNLTNFKQEFEVTSLNSSLLFSSSLLQRRNLKTNSKPAMENYKYFTSCLSPQNLSPITKRLHKARSSAFLNSLESSRCINVLKANAGGWSQFQEQNATLSSTSPSHVQPVKILADEDNDAEVGIQSVANEERWEHKEPRGFWGQQLFLDLERGRFKRLHNKKIQERCQEFLDALASLELVIRVSGSPIFSWDIGLISKQDFQTSRP